MSSTSEPISIASIPSDIISPADGPTIPIKSPLFIVIEILFNTGSIDEGY